MVKRITGTLLCLLLVAAVLAGCGGRGSLSEAASQPASSSAESRPPVSSQQPAEPELNHLTILNNSGGVLNELYIGLEGHGESWGDNWIPEGLWQGDSAQVAVEGDLLMLMFSDGDGAVHTVNGVYAPPGTPEVSIVMGQGGFGVRVDYADGSFENYYADTNAFFGTGPGPVERQTVFYTIVNDSGYGTITQVYVSTDGAWSDDVLPGQVLESGDGVQLQAYQDDYMDVQFVDGDGVAHTVYGIYLRMDCELLIWYGQGGFGIQAQYADGTFEYYPADTNLDF